MMQRTFAIIKPDAYHEHAAIITRALDKGLKPSTIQTGRPPRDWWEKFYNEHEKRDFFPELIDHMTSGPSVFIVFKGENAIEVWRELLGPTDPTKATPGTIRYDYGTAGPANAGHGSDSPEAARREISLFRGWYVRPER